MSSQNTSTPSTPDFLTLKQALREAALIKPRAQFASLAPLEPEITELLKNGYRQNEIMAILSKHKFIVSKSTFSSFVKTLNNVSNTEKAPIQPIAGDNQASVLNKPRPEKKMSPEELTNLMRKEPDLGVLEEDARNLLKNR